MMRRLALAMSVLPGLAMADTLSLTEVLQAQRWVMEEARCADVISLFTTPTEVADDVTEENSARLLFASTLMEGAALERGVS